MRLLVVMVNYPFPPRTGSDIVAYNSMKHLSKRHHIDLICLKSINDLDERAEFIDQVELLTHRKTSRFTQWLRYLIHILLGEPPSVSAYASMLMKQKVQHKVELGKFEAILLFEMSAIQYCPSSIFHKLVVNIEDPQSIKLTRMAELPIWSLWQRLKLFVLAKLTERYEDKHLRKIAKVLLLSEADVHDMSTKSAYTNLACVPYGVDQRTSAEILEYKDRERVIVFSGNMYHPPNVDGSLFLLEKIYPLILQEDPSAILWIVGANPDKRIYDAAARFGEQVVITGKVASVADYVRRAMVSICPIRLKIGVQTKILEALSWGTPVVTTNAGNSGVGGVSGTHLWVENDAPMLAKRVCELLQGREWPKLSSEGMRLVRERFSWENSVAQLEKHLEVIAGG